VTPVLVDTNILIYPLDPLEPARARQAREVLQELRSSASAALTTQVLGEFFRVATARLDPPIPPADARALVAQLVQTFPVWPVDMPVALEAARGVCDHGLAYWHAQLWATARLRGVRFVLSEDFTDGQALEGVTFRDPLRPTFSLQELLAPGS
jgi:predicted nucleic acid-binding protein